MMSAPWPLPRLIVRFIRAVVRRDLTRAAMAGGTVAVTAPGVAGRRGGWGLAPSGRSLVLIVGGIARKPAVIEDRVEPRDILNLTVAFDHDVVDGAPAARFVKRLVELIKSGYGLEDGKMLLPKPPTPDDGRRLKRFSANRMVDVGRRMLSHSDCRLSRRLVTEARLGH